jgi:regulator of replication initiation timing
VEKQNNLSTLAYTLARHIPLAGRVGLVGLGMALAPVAISPTALSAWAADGLLHNIRFDQGSRHFVIDTSGPVKAVVNTLTIAGRKRVIIDLDNADIGGDLPRDTQLLQDLTSQLPTLKNITVNQYGGNGKPIVRVLLDLQGDPGAIRLLRNQGPHIELELSDYAASGDASTNYNPPPLYQGNSNNDYDGPGGTNHYTPPTGERSLGSRVSSTQTAPDTVSREQFNQSIRTQQALQQQIDSLHRQLASQGSGPQLAEMKRTLVVMNQRYDQLTQENQNLKSKLGSAPTTPSNSTEVSRLQRQLEASQADLRVTKSQLTQLQADDTQLKAARQDLITLKAELDRLKAIVYINNIQ